MTRYPAKDKKMTFQRAACFAVIYHLNRSIKLALVSYLGPKTFEVHNTKNPFPSPIAAAKSLSSATAF